MSITLGELESFMSKVISEAADEAYKAGEQDMNMKHVRRQKFEQMTRDSTRKLAELLNSKAQKKDEPNPAL